MNTPIDPSKLDDIPSKDYFVEAIGHVDSAVNANNIALGAAKGILYSLVETLGSMIGDPDLPNHVRSGYEGALELAHELQAKFDNLS